MRIVNNIYKWIIILGLAGIYFACNHPKGSPKDSLSKFLQAMKDNSFDTAKQYATSGSQDFLDMISKKTDGTNNLYNNQTFSIDSVVINDDDAKAQVTANGGVKLSYTLHYEHGLWRVIFNQETVAKMANNILEEEGENITNDILKQIDSLKINLDSLP